MKENGKDVQEIEKAKEFVPILISNVWDSAVIDFGYVSSKALWVEFKFSRVKSFVVVVYGSTEEMVVYWIWSLCNIAFEIVDSSSVQE